MAAAALAGALIGAPAGAAVMATVDDDAPTPGGGRTGSSQEALPADEQSFSADHYTAFLVSEWAKMGEKGAAIAAANGNADVAGFAAPLQEMYAGIAADMGPIADRLAGQTPGENDVQVTEEMRQEIEDRAADIRGLNDLSGDEQAAEWLMMNAWLHDSIEMELEEHATRGNLHDAELAGKVRDILLTLDAHLPTADQEFSLELGQPGEDTMPAVHSPESTPRIVSAAAWQSAPAPAQQLRPVTGSSLSPAPARAVDAAFPGSYGVPFRAVT